MAAAKKKTKTSEDFFNSDLFDGQAFKENFEKIAGSMTEFVEFQRESLETGMNSLSTVASGMEVVASEQTAFVKESYEIATETFQAASSSKSAQEVIEIQMEFLKSATERNVSFASKLSDHWVSVAKEAFEPTTKHYGEYLEKVQTFRP